MLQQTTVKAVAPYYERFLLRWPDVAALAAASLDDVLRAWAGLGYYARARNLHACAREVARRGEFPLSEEGLRALPGVGDYTAAAIAAIAFDAPAVPVDGNIERVVTRLHAVEDALPKAKPLVRALAARLVPPHRSGDFAQALMDLGATICTPKKPTCALCPWAKPCAARRRGDAETFPRKAPKAEGRLRRGVALWVTRAGADVLVRSRPAKGLLGGMTEVPGSDWRFDLSEGDALAQAVAPIAESAIGWRRLPGVVTHTFTHFPLALAVYAGDLPAGTPAFAGMRWVARGALAGEALPSLMRKVVAHAQDAQTVHTRRRKYGNRTH
jgi:A/G-specific adenine glycosylase